MASGGYDLGISSSATSSAAQDQASAFNVTGGGKASSNAVLWVLGGLGALFLLWLVFRRFES